ncbi:MAG: DUF6069 family protein [bacterium]|nr:DUF6069 family protein [bacterium]
MKTKLTFAQSMKAGAFAAGAAVVINLALFFIFKAVGTITDNIFIQPNTPLTAVPVIIATIVPALIACSVFFLIEKFTTNGFHLFRIVSIVLLLLSFINPFMGIPGVTAAYAVSLNVMHVVVVAALLFFIGKATKAKQ